MLLAIVKDTHVEAPEEFSKKATPLFAHVADKFYAKVNDDVYLNIGQYYMDSFFNRICLCTSSASTQLLPPPFVLDVLGAALATHLDKPCIYIGCMQSGEVFSEL